MGQWTCNLACIRATGFAAGRTRWRAQLAWRLGGAGSHRGSQPRNRAGPIRRMFTSQCFRHATLAPRRRRTERLHSGLTVLWDM